MQKLKKSPSLIVSLAILLVLGISYLGYFNLIKKMNVASADDNGGQEVDQQDSNSGDAQSKDNEDSQNSGSSQSKDTNSEDNNTAVNGKTEQGDIQEQARKSAAGQKEQGQENGNGDNNNGGDGQGNESDNSNGDVQDINGKISEMQARIDKASSKGADVSALSASLNDIKDLVAKAGSESATDPAAAKADLESAAKKLDALENSMEQALGKNEDGNKQANAGNENENTNEDAVAKSYKNTVAQFVHSLSDLADKEGGIGQQVKVVAQAQNESQAKVDTAVSAVDDRSGFVKFLIGPNYGQLNNIKTEISANENRIQVLTQVMNEVQDANAKAVLQEQINNLQQQNSQLQNFVNSNESKPSMLGWLIRLFS